LPKPGDIGKPTPPLSVKWHAKWKRWVIVGANGYLYPSIYRAMAWEEQENALGFLKCLQASQQVP